MVTINAVRRSALRLPDVEEGTRFGRPTWFVRRAAFAWLRPFSKADVRRFGDSPVPTGEILAVAVADLSEKDAALAAHPDAIFTIEHFEGFAAVLIRLEVATTPVVQEALVDAWCAKAPAQLVEQYLADHPRRY